MKFLLSTRRKLQIARFVSCGLRAARRIAGRSDRTYAVRGGVRWSLDLAEGIDLAVYLGVYQKIGKYVAKTVLKPGIVALDIGANVGAFTLPLACQVGNAGRVIAIEPTVYAFEKLRANLALNPDLSTRVIAIQVLLGATDEAPNIEGVYSSWRLSGPSAGVRHPEHGGMRMSITGALCYSIDTLLADDPRLAGLSDRIAFIKLDVDGHEIDIIRGAQRFLARNRPAMLIEIAPYVQNERPNGFELLLSEISRRGYALYDAEDGTLLPSDPRQIKRLIPYGSGIDVLCLPR